MNTTEIEYCLNCGSPKKNGVCPNCNYDKEATKIYQGTNYPEIECKSVKFSFFNTVFPGIFFVTYTPVGLIPLFINKYTPGNEDFYIFLLSFGIFFIGGIIAGIIMLLPFIKYMILKTNGLEVQGTLIDYIENRNERINGVHTKTMKIIVNTDEGPKIIKYNTGSTRTPYPINSVLRLLMYKNYFRIIK
jgi:hypothetical protein